MSSTTLTSEFCSISNELGLHLRAARKLVDAANRFQSKIELEKEGGPTINAKSILGVLLLEGIRGTSMRVLADGADAREAIQALVALIESGFGEL
jgi:phosphocarrier protein HPr